MYFLIGDFMKILGLDLSLNCSGLSIWEDGKIIFYDTIEHPRKTSFEDKLLRIGDYIENLLDTHLIDLAVIEDVFSDFAGTGLILAKVHGVVLRELDRHKVKYIYYTATEIKKAVLGKIPTAKKGEPKIDTKVLVAAEVFKLYPEIPTDCKNDVTDATACILCYISRK
jgi:Holliday junction resolvasome RuvABC endonuclease subunit